MPPQTLPEVALLDQQLLGNAVRAWLVAGIILFTVLAGLWVAKRLGIRYLSRLARQTATQLDDLLVDLLSRTRIVFVLFVALFAATFALHLPPEHVRLVRTAAVIAFLLQCALWGNQIVTYGLARYLRVRGAEDAAGLTMVTTLGYVARGLLWVMLLLLALDNLGIKVTGLITGLGIGGVAVALAAQEVLKDLFASLAIIMDKPFLIGDSIWVDQFQGQVEHIGIKTTRLRSVSGEELIFSNSDILNSRIRNFKRMEERRVVLHLGIVYDTREDKLAAIPQIVTEILATKPSARLDRVHFASFGESSLNFEIAYYVEDPDFKLFMGLQHEVNLAIVRRFRQEGIDFAYPTRTLKVERAPENGVGSGLVG